MLDTEQLQILVQLIDNMETLIEKIESAYSKNNADAYKRSNNEVLDIQRKINSMLKEQ
ncbi:MAG: hypothetical protein ABIH37_01860 [archaeon]